MNQLTSIFKLLSDETRLRMLFLLYQEELCVCELAGITDSPQPRISKNLSKLRDLNIVVDERKDKFIFYTLKRDNTFLIQILQSIYDEIERYPMLVTDRERLLKKGEFITQCKTN